MKSVVPVESVAPVESMPMETMAAVAASMAPVAHWVAWRGRNDKERNYQEGDRYSSHC